MDFRWNKCENFRSTISN